MLRIAVLDDYQRVALRMADWDRLGPDCTVTSFGRHLADLDTAAEALRDFEVLCLMRERMEMPAALFGRLPNLRLVVVTGSRVRCIDYAAARGHGVIVSLTGGASNNGPAELAVALILAAARRIPQEDRSLRAGVWQSGLGILLEGRVLGVLGLGRIGQRVARIGAALGMRTLAWSPNLTPERAAEAGVDYAPREAFFATADVISVHMVLSGSTRGLVGGTELALMKPTALLVNTSRGGLIDEAALIDALGQGRIGGAALDVFETEPLPAGHPLLGFDNTVLTPHIGFVNDENYRVQYGRTVAAIEAWRAGAPTMVQDT